MIKYLGSKRKLVPVLGRIAAAVGAKTAVDLFTGTTRVAQEFKRRGIFVTACDLASYSAVFSDCYIATDAKQVDLAALDAAIDRLNALSPIPGYFTETFCEQSRFFQPKNGAHIDAIRDVLEAEYRESPLYPILLTSLILAADRVDSTTGQQMAYLKQWSPRSFRDLQLRRPELLPGPGVTRLGDAAQLISQLPPVDLIYLDPPYNQHRYFTNYHIWETLVRWDAPENYGVAHKRIDAKVEDTKSIFNSKPAMPKAFAELLSKTKAKVLVVSYNDEGWITPEEMTQALHDAGHDQVSMFSFDYQRYIGARLGIYNPSGVKVGKISHLSNHEHIFVAGAELPSELFST